MFSVVSLGVDIVSVKRVKDLYSRYGERFLRRVYVGKELQYVQKRPDTGPFLAGRFAGKEAVLKALGCGLFSGIRLTEIEIRSQSTGQPYCVLSGNARTRAGSLGIKEMLISISHCDEYAISQVIGVAGE